MVSLYKCTNFFYGFSNSTTHVEEGSLYGDKDLKTMLATPKSRTFWGCKIREEGRGLLQYKSVKEDK